MTEPVQVEVKSDLRKIIAELEQLAGAADGVSQHLQRAGDETEKNLARNTKDVETMLERVRDLGRRMADQIRGYFKDLAVQIEHSLEESKKDLGIKRQFIDATQEAINFNAVLHRIGTTLGFNSDQVADFQKKATQAFANIGMDANAAASALEGVSQTQVRGEGNILKTATTGAELAELSGEKGNEGGIAKALADALQAQGKNPNDMKAMEDLAESARRNFNNTGEAPSQYLNRTASLFGEMSPEDRQRMSSEGMRNLSAVGSVVGPGFEDLVKQMTAGHLEKLPLEAQGFGGLIGSEGVNFERLQRVKGIGQRIGGDQVAAFQTAGLSKEAATALVKLIDMADQAKKAQDRAGRDIQGGPTSIAEQAKSSRGLPQNFEAAKAQVQGVIGAAEAPFVEIANKVVGKASESKLGSAALLGGGFIAAATGSWALGKLAKKIGGGKDGLLGDAEGAAAAVKKAAMVEQITGQKTMPVYVVNVTEFANALLGGNQTLPGVGTAAGLAGGGGGLLQFAGKAAGIGGAILGAHQLIDQATMGKSEETGVEGGVLTRAEAYAIDKLTGGKQSKAYKSANDTEAQIAAAKKRIEAEQKITITRDESGHVVAKTLKDESRKNREHDNKKRLDSTSSNSRRGAPVGAPNR